LKVYDREKFKNDDFVGEATHLLDKNGFIKVPLFEGNLQAGFIFVTIETKY
jgi:hypothetical protein